jgi:hypothetical protein
MLKVWIRGSRLLCGFGSSSTSENQRETRAMTGQGCERDLAVTYVFVPPKTVMIHTEDVTEVKQAEHQREAHAAIRKTTRSGTDGHRDRPRSQSIADARGQP